LIEGNHVVALIPARGGSKSIPYKNLHALGGKPLLAWPVEVALATRAIDRVLVSTDDARIAGAARELGAEVIDRSPELASDTALVIDVIRQVAADLAPAGRSVDIMVLLEATSPFRSPEMITRCLERMVREKLDSIATFHAADINPERTWRIENGEPRPFIDGAIPWKPRQMLTPAFQLNGAVYAFRPDRLPASGASLLFGKTGAEIVSPDEVIDIDDEKDFFIADAILRSRQRA
jgi:CMP-N,N'-diacetyllegionaminic acid synthase